MVEEQKRKSVCGKDLFGTQWIEVPYVLASASVSVGHMGSYPGYIGLVPRGVFQYKVTSTE